MSCHACEQQHELKEATKFLLQGGEAKEKVKWGHPWFLPGCGCWSKPLASVLQPALSLVQPISCAVKKSLHVVIRHEKC